MPFSIYTSAFNVEKHKFSWREALNSYLNFAGEDGEVVVAVNTSEDESLALIRAFAKDEPTLKVVATDFSYTDPDMDGLIKNAALQATTKDAKIGLDLDEYIPLWQKGMWQRMWNELRFSSLQSFFVPSVNLYGDVGLISEINQKWYIHKSGLYRGTVAFARRQDGTHDITKSDSCELIDASGNLVSAWFIIDPSLSTEEKIRMLGTGRYPFVVHLGYVDLFRRTEINKNFWSKHWSVEDGSPQKTIESLQGFDKRTYTSELAVRPIYG